ncbi:MAG: hypothetical protein M3Y48_15220, partial [Actinomycetota bacterium]|nr:hypothetical protein [Actinomycetota bacterium]
ALVLGLSLPEQYVSRSAFAEPALQVLLFGGLCLLIDSLTLRADAPVLVSGWRRLVSVRAWSHPVTPERTMAALGGLALGLGLLVSLDSLIYLLPLIPFGGLLLAARQGRHRRCCPAAGRSPTRWPARRWRAPGG